MKIHKTDGFLNAVDKPPTDTKRILGKQENIFFKNRLNPQFHVKRLKDLTGVFFSRVMRRCRALFYLRKKEAIFFAIGHRKDICKK